MRGLGGFPFATRWARTPQRRGPKQTRLDIRPTWLKKLEPVKTARAKRLPIHLAAEQGSGVAARLLEIEADGGRKGLLGAEINYTQEWAKARRKRRA